MPNFALAAAFVLVLICANAFAQQVVQSLFPVEAVSRCHEPRRVWHVRSPKCEGEREDCRSPVLYPAFHELTNKVPLLCDTSLPPPEPEFAAKSSIPISWINVGSASPECYTVAVARGPGMRGVFPGRCVEIGGAQPHWGLGQKASKLSSIVAFLSRDGKILGSGLALAPNLVITAQHVIGQHLEESPVEVVSGYWVDDLGNLAPLNRTFALKAGVEADGYFPSFDTVASSPLGALDFSVIRLLTEDAASETIAASKVACPNSRGVSQAVGFIAASIQRPQRKHKVNDPVYMLGYTSNPFFPRGLIASNQGQIVAHRSLELDESTQYIFHNLQSAPGFSGAPVFSRDLEWIALHQATLSVLTNVDDIQATGALRDFNLPNRAVSAERIVQSIACQLGADGIQTYCFAPDFKKWLIDSLGACK